MNLRLTRVETFSTEFVCFVRATLEDGSQGWGQVAPYHADITALVLHRQVAPHVLGTRLLETESSADAAAPAGEGAGQPGDAPGPIENAISALGERVTDREHKFPGSYLRRAFGGLDTALWDLFARRAGKSVCELIGGRPGVLRAYASSMRRDITPEDEAVRLKHLADTSGYTAFKFRVGAECGHDRDEWPGRTETIVPTVRRALGDDAALLVDANSCYSPARAIEVGALLEASGICHFEEPCPYWEYEQTREVTRALSIDVTGGEQDCELQNWRRMIEEHVVDVVQPDVCYLGGLARTLAVARLAAAAGLPCTPHCANLSMVTLFTMHLLRAIPNRGPYLEFSIEGPDYYPWQYGLFENDPYAIVDGQVAVTDAPGWGARPAAAWLGRADYRCSEC